MLKSWLILVGLLALSFAQKPTPQQRAAKLLAQMNITEKIGMVHGYSQPKSPYYAGVVNSNPALGIPALHLEDGPQGVADGTLEVTAWPSALTVVASWNVSAQFVYAQAMAEEQYIKGTSIMLGPMVNIARVPYGGRNFESYGEDPHLSATMVVPCIQGIQSKGVMACVKHFIDNNQEFNRTLTSANVDERSQWEIYYPAFQAAVDAGVGSVMCSYNRINDTYACENAQTLNNDLKGRMGFQGFVMSDWGATHSTVNAANNGLDMQMPDAWAFGEALLQAVQDGDVSEDRLDDMVTRILVPMFTVGLFDTPNYGNLTVNAMSPAHNLLSRQLAEDGTVLLKNADNMLPLSASANSQYVIAVIGDDGSAHPVAVGCGSGGVQLPYLVTPLQGIESRVAGTGIKVIYAPTSPQATQVAAQADLAIVFVSADSCEGQDRTTLELLNNQDQLIFNVTAVQPNVIVVMHTPGAILMPWIDEVDSIVCAFLPGQEDGNAIASILFGDVNPSGHLPVTFPVNEREIPVNTIEQYPGIDNNAAYSEKLLVGYRWYDARDVTPLFPFGHGLSYTTFLYSDIVIQPVLTNFTVSFYLTNTGSVAGAEVVQMYLGYPIEAGEPPKVLRGFDKVMLQPGASQMIEFMLSPRDFSIWSIEAMDWEVISGTFTVMIGSSSRDIRLAQTFVSQ